MLLEILRLGRNCCLETSEFRDRHHEITVQFFGETSTMRIMQMYNNLEESPLNSTLLGLVI